MYVILLYCYAAMRILKLRKCLALVIFCMFLIARIRMESVFRVAALRVWPWPPGNAPGAALAARCSSLLQGFYALNERERERESQSVRQ